MTPRRVSNVAVSDRELHRRFPTLSPERRFQAACWQDAALCFTHQGKMREAQAALTIVRRHLHQGRP